MIRSKKTVPMSVVDKARIEPQRYAKFLVGYLAISGNVLLGRKSGGSEL